MSCRNLESSSGVQSREPRPGQLTHGISLVRPMLGDGLSARAGPRPRPPGCLLLRLKLLGRPLLEAPVAGPEVGPEAAEAMETDKATAKGDQGPARAMVAPQDPDLPGAIQVLEAPGLPEAGLEAVQAMAAADQGRPIQEEVVVRTLGATTTHQVEDLTRQAEAVAVADRIRPGDVC